MPSKNLPLDLGCAVRLTSNLAEGVVCKSIGWSTRPEKQPTERGEPHWLPCVYGKWATASICATPLVVSARSVIPEAVSAVGQLSDLRANCPRKRVERHVASYTPRTSQYVTGKAREREKKKDKRARARTIAMSRLFGAHMDCLGHV